MTIPCDYDSIFSDRLLLLTGVGRSGTTILGKLLGSMKPAYLVFEPALFKYVSPSTEGFLGTLFEDYFLPIIQGRGNWNSRDWSSIHNQMTFGDIMWRWDNLSRRSDAIKLIEREQPLFIVKSLEYQNDFNRLRSVIPVSKYIEIIRSGCDVVRSAVERGWFTDEWCNSAMIQRDIPIIKDSKCTVPDYLMRCDGSISSWLSWSPLTRAACAWRCLVDFNPGPAIRYEEFIASPDYYAVIMASEFDLKLTPLTEKFITEIKQHSRTKREKFDINLIQEPERERFIEKNRQLGYDIP